jgi:hypothetical protein
MGNHTIDTLVETTTQYYIAKNGNRSGPFSQEQIQGMLSSSVISLDDLVWHEGQSDWKPLSALFGPSQPPPIRATGVANTIPSATTATVLDGPKGQGGWLVFFCVALTILGPLFSIGQMVAAWEQSEPAFGRFPSIKSAMILENFGLAALLIYGFILGCIIWGGNPKGKRLAKQYLLIRLFGFFGIELVALMIIADLPSQVLAAGVGAVIGAGFREILFFLIWWFYFKKSKRVRNTYGHN